MTVHCIVNARYLLVCERTLYYHKREVETFQRIKHEFIRPTLAHSECATKKRSFNT